MSAHSSFTVIQDKKPLTDHFTILEKGIYTLISREFQNYTDFRVISNLKKYKPGEDPFIFGQKIGKIPELCEVYMKGEYICEISIFDTPAQALTKIHDGMIEMVADKARTKKHKEEA